MRVPPGARRYLAAVCAVGAIVADIVASILVVEIAAMGGRAIVDDQTVGGIVLGASYSIVGWLIASRRNENAIGWIFLAIGFSQAVDALATEAAVYGLRMVPGSLPLATVMSWLAEWAWVPGYTLLLTLSVLLFPDGHLPSPRWRPVAWAAVIVMALLALPIAIVTWPHQGIALITDAGAQAPGDVGAVEQFVGSVGIPALVILAVVSVIGMVVRFRRSQGIERQQLKWFTWAGILEIGVVLTIDSVKLEPTVGALVAIAVTPLLPIAATVAILRHGLYEIDRIVSRTLVYGALTAILAAVYGGGFLILQGILTPFTSGRPIAVAASTLAAFALIQPLRRRIQAVMDRRFYRYRYDAERTTAAFSERLREEVDLVTLTRELDTAVRRVMSPSSVGLWLRGGGR